MLRLTSGRPDRWHPFAERGRAEGPPVELLVAGAVVVGLGVLAWVYLGADLKRYLEVSG